VAFLDSDDAWYPDKLEKQIADLRAHPECGWSYTFTCRMGEKPNLSRFRPLRGWIRQDLMTLNAFVALPTVMARRQLLREVGGFDEAFVFCGDYELWIRLAGVSQVTVVPEALAWVRSHPGSHTSGRLGVWEAWVRLYEKLMLTQDDSRVTALARKRRTESLMALADQYARARRHPESLVALGRSALWGIATRRWWVVLLQGALRMLIPASVLAYRRRLTEPAAQRIQADKSRPTSSAARRISSR
jgi:GT2 family glycosyltransferase